MICRCFLAVSFISLPLLAMAQDETWTGKQVVLKRPGLRIGYTDADGSQVYVAELTNLSYKVLDDHGGFLRVQHRGTSGWFPKIDAFLPEDAVSYFAERSRLAPPNDSVPLAYLGWAHRLRKEHDRALAAYDAAIQREPRPEWHNNRGLIHLDMNKPVPAIADFSQAIQRDPKFVVAYENRAAAHEAKNDHAEAIKDWTRAVELDPKNATTLLRRARAYMRQKDFDKAAADLTASLESAPKNVPALLERAQLQADLGKTDAAIADLTAVLKIDDKNIDALLARAQLHADRKDYAKARGDIDAALAARPMSVDALVARGWNRFMLGEFAGASDDFIAARSSDPKHAGAPNGQAWLLATCPDAKFRDGKKAVELAKQAIALHGGVEAALLDTHAAALAEAGDFSRAVTVQEQAVRAFGTSPQAAEAAARLELYRKKQPYRQAISK